MQDNIPLIDPMELFEGAEYKQSGSVFWSDLNKDHRESSYRSRSSTNLPADISSR